MHRPKPRQPQPPRHGHRPGRRPAAALIGLLLAVSTLLTGCASLVPLPGLNTEETTMDPAAELAARPRLEEMVARYEQMQQRLRDQLDAELGPFAWYQRREPTESLCGFEYDDLNARRWYLASWIFDGPISELDWPRAREIVAEVTAEYGFVLAGLAIDQPGHHVVNGTDPTLDAKFDFGSKDNTSIQVTTGCHLPTNP